MKFFAKTFCPCEWGWIVCLSWELWAGPRGAAVTDLTSKGQSSKTQREYKIKNLTKYCRASSRYIELSTVVLRCNCQVIGDTRLCDCQKMQKADSDLKESNARHAVNFGLYEVILFLALSNMIIHNLNSSETKSKVEGTLQSSVS